MIFNKLSAIEKEIKEIRAVAEGFSIGELSLSRAARYLRIGTCTLKDAADAKELPAMMKPGVKNVKGKIVPTIFYRFRIADIREWQERRLTGPEKSEFTFDSKALIKSLVNDVKKNH